MSSGSNNPRLIPPADRAPFFSIIVCCYDSIQYIAQCVESILGQTFQSYEIVFVDGGSRDGTLDYIRNTPGRTTIVTDTRGGIAIAMNAGISVARGELIAHLHADDYYIDKHVLNTVHRLFSHAPDAQWAYGQFKNDIDGTVVEPSYPVRPYRRGTLLRRNLIPHCATFVRSNVFLELGMFDISYRLAMDYDMWLRIAARYEPIQIDTFLGVFRRHDGSATTANKMRSFNEDFRARFRHAPLWLWPEFAARYVYRRLREV